MHEKETCIKRSKLAENGSSAKIFIYLAHQTLGELVTFTSLGVKCHHFLQFMLKRGILEKVTAFFELIVFTTFSFHFKVN